MMKRIISLFLALITILSVLCSCSSKLVFYDSRYDVKVYGDFFPGDSYFSFEYYPFESLAMEELLSEFQEKGMIFGEKDDFFIYEIKCISSGSEVQPTDQVEIRMKKPEEMIDENEFSLYNVKDNVIERIEFKLKGKYLCFKTDTFSYFVFLKNEVMDTFYIALNTEGPGKIVDKNGKKVNYVNLLLGDTVTFRAVPDKGHKFVGWYNSEKKGIYISTEEYYTYTYSDLNEEGFFIYAEFE